MNEINWEELKKLVDDTAAKRDRKVKIFISTTTGTSISIEPWPDIDELYQMYQEGKITFNDFRARSGLSLIREEDFINSKSRFNLKFKGE